MGVQIAPAVSLNLWGSEINHVKNECSKFFDEGILDKVSTYFLSFFSSNLRVSYLKQRTCEILFDSECRSFKLITDQFISNGNGIIGELNKYSDKIQFGSVSVFRLLSQVRDRNRQYSLLGEAARYQMLSVVNTLLKNKADVNFGRNSPLHRAAVGANKKCAGTQYPQIARALINNGAYVDAKNEFKDTPLHLSVSCLPFVKVLVEEGGASINAENVGFLTPLDLLELRSCLFSANTQELDYLRSKNAKNGVIYDNNAIPTISTGINHLLKGFSSLIFKQKKSNVSDFALGLLNLGAGLTTVCFNTIAKSPYIFVVGKWNQLFYSQNRTKNNDI